MASVIRRALYTHSLSLVSVMVGALVCLASGCMTLLSILFTL